MERRRVLRVQTGPARKYSIWIGSHSEVKKEHTEAEQKRKEWKTLGANQIEKRKENEKK